MITADTISSLREAVLTDPNDTEVRLIYADALEESGESTLASFWRETVARRWKPDVRRQYWTNGWSFAIGSSADGHWDVPKEVWKWLEKINEDVSTMWVGHETEREAWENLERAWLKWWATKDFSTAVEENPW